MLGVNRYLGRTKSLDFDEPRIADAVAGVTQGATDEVDKAVCIHDFVRDKVLFGWMPTFDAHTASETLASRIGFCNTKTPLFVAMCRAAGIPARVHIVGIDKHVLDHVIDPVDKFIDHAYAEVQLGGQWLGVDSYIVDKPLFDAAMARLRASGRTIGFGLHVNGRATWDGRSHSFSQFVNDGSASHLSDVDFGTFDDVDEFYDSGRARTSRNPLFRAVVLRTLLHFGNRRVRALRASGAGAAQQPGP